ncbi:DUF4199 domain-containing protein [Mucilaginibacter glaciei]|uniref:DUF4199 domain-containing protein n=1 Tax=Mucilaginibacter glaciei TaxID=2772109 RepID=A0A926NJF0_9SPHI|nr:DUF4199 domain-containing protein [Mucilaginibacter glaciei]MBD1392331.1 DUF4199 domain-containing protein [Mucilaginibacter glaciei]
MTETTDQQIRKQALTKGLLLGIIMSVLSIFSFYYITSMVTSLLLITVGPFIISAVLPLVVAILFSFDLRKAIGGFWNFKQAVTGIFIMFFAAYLIQYLLVSLLFAKVIEPQMVEKTKTAMTTAVSGMLEKSNASQNDIDAKMEDIQKQFDAQKDPTVAKQFQSFAISILFVFVVALIFAAFFKKERPLYLTADEPDPTV